jgi:hypothetical protein
MKKIIMKKNLILLSCFLLTMIANAQNNNYNGGLHILGNPNCNNLTFEDTNFVGWVGQTGKGPQAPIWNGGIMNVLNATEFDTLSRQTILTTPPGNNNPANGALVGWDAFAINPVTLVSDIPYLCPFGGNVSVRLGNSNDSAEVENLSYTMLVNALNTSFNYYYAVVLELPAGHPPNSRPYFTINIKDAQGALIEGPFGVFDTSYIQTTKGPIIDSIPSDCSYKKWTLDTFDLSNYLGQTVTIVFQTGDCDHGGHFGYAYIDGSCSQYQAGIISNSNNSNLNIFPNPTSGSFTIELVSKAQVSITNALGEEVFNQQMESGKQSLSLQNQGDGVYFVKVVGEDKQQVKKLIKAALPN